MPDETVPVAVMSFNRPHYLRKVLESIKAQRNERCQSQFSFHFFQDGAVNRYSGRRYAEDGEIDQCLSVIREYFPVADVRISPNNIGVSEMMLWAETVAFEEIGAEVGIFIEDDMVLDARYLETMSRIWKIIRPVREIGYFAAYGDFYVDAQGIMEAMTRPQRWCPLSYNWAFGLRRDHWEEMRPTLHKYYEIVHGRDYRMRKHIEVRRLFADLGVPIIATSQDAAKYAATSYVSHVRINIEVPLGRYIGETGLHFTPEIYRELGFSLQERPVPAGDIALQPFTPEDLARLRRCQATETMRERSVLNERFGFRLLTAEEVRRLFLDLLGREPESQAVYDANVGKQTFVALRNMLIDSAEYRENN